MNRISFIPQSAIRNPQCRPAYEHGACAAVAFATDDFRADEAATAAEIVGEREKRVATADFVTSAVNVEDEVVAHGAG